MIKPSLLSLRSTLYGDNSLHKDPWLAVNLSMFFPGIGQFYAGKILQGWFWIIAQLTLLMFTIWSMVSPDGQVSLGLAGLVSILVIYLMNILDAHRGVYLALGDETLEKIPRRQKTAWFAVFASRILPGLGQLYGEKVSWGIAFLAVSMIATRLDDFFSALLFLPPAVMAIATYHAYHTFPHPYHPHRFTYRSILALMVGMIFSWGIICNYLPDWVDSKIALFEIPSQSMVPTLQVGDRVLVSKSSDYQPQRGHIVVFQTPEKVKQLDPTSGDFFIKRVIGLPGDRIQVHQGKVYLNDRVLEEPYIAALADYELPPLIVPSQRLFVLGDNRTQSFDSHAWGFLPEENLVGQAYKIAWPLDRVRSLMSSSPKSLSF